MWISNGKSKSESNWKPFEVEWEPFVEGLKTPRMINVTEKQLHAMNKEQKDAAKDGRAFVGGYVKGPRSKELVKFRDVVCLDADNIPEEVDFMAECKKVLEGVAFCAYTTISHTKKANRYRLVIPCDRITSREEYEATSNDLMDRIGRGYFDTGSDEWERLMFYPSVTTDGQYKCEVQAGGRLPTKMADRREKKTMEKREDKHGVVRAFWDAYNMEEAIDTFLPHIYTPDGDGRWTYVDGTSARGVVLNPDDTVQLHHGTDPAAAVSRVMNPFDLVRVHLYGHLDKAGDGGIDSPSFKAMAAMVKGDERVRQEAFKEFDNVVELEKPQKLSKHWHTDLGAAEDMKRITGDRLGYCYTTGTWWAFDGKKWEEGQQGEVERAPTHVAKLRLKQAALSAKEDEVKALIKHSTKLMSSGGAKATIERARGIMELKYEDLDSDPYKLNCQNGVLDLKTFELKPHAPGHMCSMICGAPYDPNATAPKWEEFLEMVTESPGRRLENGDAWDGARLRHFMAKFAGLSLVGELMEQVFFFIYGKSANGKSTFIDTITEMMGSYAGVIPVAELAAGQRGSSKEQAQPHLFSIMKNRMVSASETEEGTKLNEALIRNLTGDANFKVRTLHGKPVVFEPGFCLVMFGNHRPPIKSENDSTWRRVVLIPFENEIPENKRKPKPEIMAAFRDEMPGILNWAVKGLMYYQLEGFNKPGEVELAIGSYRAENDLTAQFIDECCEIDPDGQAAAGELYKRYADWMDRQGIRHPGDNRKFKERMLARGFNWKKTKAGNVYTGLKMEFD